ncbi:HTTM domain-containing protein [Lignipirellula cremea]|uniref:HTTM-like domain-containing protein n=1 Tax=Lignipirellula cremea TaxID=2528010 RepID=A0A518DS25_9BACT|nr:HTTM domain-containing protein [Lignipirellula cremea]QDU94637.1 hypothetical protein Pla8534_24300 [Lignipirellula cremea]
MNGLISLVGGQLQAALRGWDRFWFTPSQPHTLALIRILGGAMLLYTHLVWSLDLMAFLGPNSWIPTELSQEMASNGYAWSHLWYVDSPGLLWTLHLAALVVFVMLTLGLFTRFSSIAAAVVTISYCHRLQGSLFGLDQINAMLALYLAVGDCGGVWSLDRWLAQRRGVALPTQARASTNIAIRLIQVHMCVIYLFGGLAKAKGELWWDGSALWFSAANYEYQSLDLTWIGHYPLLIAFLSHVTVFWETFYCVLIWPRATRPYCMAMAVMVHGGIAMFLGMITFGLVMLIGNLAFVPPELTAAAVARCQAAWPKRASLSKTDQEPATA